MTDDILRRARRAESLLNDELLTEAFDALRTTYLAAIEDSKVDQTDVREKLYAHITTLKSVRGHLRSVMENGKLLLHEQNELSGRQGHAL